jgi:cyclophilin family peptidyl-prolyl cis-trans isomerase
MSPHLLQHRISRHLVVATILAVIALAPFIATADAQTHPISHRAVAPAAKPVEPTGPTVVIDTSLGRITCRLYDKLAPITSANFLGLADGSKDWHDAATDTTAHGKPFYDGTALAGITDGILGGDRLGSLKGTAGPPFPLEVGGLGYDRAGRLVMAKFAPPGAPALPALSSSSVFYLTYHADKEYDRRGGTVFGQCDDASLPIIEALSHALLTVDNHPSPPLAIDHITVLHPGDSTPPIPPHTAPEAITPQIAPMPVSPIPAPEPTGPNATIETTLGTLTCKLFSQEAPIAVANFIGLANGTKPYRNPATRLEVRGKRFYDGLSFRRVIPDFMVQQADMPGDPSGDGDLGFHFANEIVPGLTFDRPGRLAYANAGPDTNQSEFFVTEHPTHRLDGNFTIFGQCDDASVKVVEAIARVPRDDKNRPLKPVTIRGISVTAPGKF